MGLLIDGRWHDQWYDTSASGGRFVRQDSVFHNWVTTDGTPGPTGVGGYRAEAGRYHLYVSLACPWAHRTLIFRALKGLTPLIDVSVVHWLMAEQGWSFAAGDGVVPDPIGGAHYLHEVYTRSDPTYSGHVTVPVLWDKRTGTTVNNGVYRAGFATTQEAYEEAVGPLFETLDWLEDRLSSRRFLTGGEITEADWRLFTTLIRFDPVYVGHFKCNIRRIADYPRLSDYMRTLFWFEGVAATVNIGHIKRHYYQSHRNLNPSGIVPVGPELAFVSRASAE